MEYKISISLRAQQEIDDAIGYYQLHSLKAPALFIEEVRNTFKILAQNPFFAVKYKNVRAIKIKKFPYSLYFIVNKSKKTVRILACFHTKRNPEKLPRK
ncbi:type II toxin-antitoxin system RelE/ParE family toxin [Petrimonas sp.]|uniref:type II toxin-antitoxin system RelE/ParE family toxin n=1 Tax=Petrimonas sp. TaxID=2023866 RepID=UPI003F50FF17